MMNEPQRLSNDRIMSALLLAQRLEEHLDWVRLCRESVEIQAKINVFEAVVWFPHLQAQVNGTDARGMRGTCRGIDVLTWCCAGRCLVQLEREGSRVTLITADDEKPWAREMEHVAPNMGPMALQGIDAGYIEALKLLYEATRYGQEIRLRPDGNVTIG